MTLEDAIREAAQAGRLNGLTLWRNSDGKYEAGRRARKGDGFQVAVDADPVAALLGALGKEVGLRWGDRDLPKDDGGIFG